MRLQVILVHSLRPKVAVPEDVHDLYRHAELRLKVLVNPGELRTASAQQDAIDPQVPGVRVWRLLLVESIRRNDDDFWGGAT